MRLPPTLQPRPGSRRFSANQSTKRFWPARSGSCWMVAGRRLHNYRQHCSGGQQEVEHRQSLRQAFEAVDPEHVAPAEHALELIAAAAIEPDAEHVDAGMRQALHRAPRVLDEVDRVADVD